MKTPLSPAITSVLVTSVPITPGPAGARNIDAFQSRVIAYVIRCLAVRDLPQNRRPCPDRWR